MSTASNRIRSSSGCTPPDCGQTGAKPNKAAVEQNPLQLDTTPVHPANLLNRRRLAARTRVVPVTEPAAATKTADGTTGTTTMETGRFAEGRRCLPLPVPSRNSSSMPVLPADRGREHLGRLWLRQNSKQRETF